jgi:hypothetical protein
MEDNLAFSQKLYDNWKVVLSLYFGFSMAFAVLRIIHPSYPSFAIRATIEIALTLPWFPGFLYVFGEFVRLINGDELSRKFTKIIGIGLLAIGGFGVAIPNTYNIALDAFGIVLPSSPILPYALIGGSLGGHLTSGIAAVYGREVGPKWAEIPEPIQAPSLRAGIIEGLEPIGFALLAFGFALGFGVTAFAAFLLICAGAILLPIGYVLRKVRKI